MNGAPHAATPAAAAVVAVAVPSPAAASPAAAATVASPPPLLALGGGDSNSSTALNSPKPLPTNTNTDSEEGAQTSVEETHTPYHSEEAVQQTESEFGSFTGVPLRLTLPQPLPNFFFTFRRHMEPIVDQEQALEGTAAAAST